MCGSSHLGGAVDRLKRSSWQAKQPRQDRTGPALEQTARLRSVSTPLLPLSLIIGLNVDL